MGSRDRREGQYPQDIREPFAEHDLFGLPFGTEHGGMQHGTLILNMAIEEIARSVPAVR